MEVLFIPAIPMNADQKIDPKILKDFYGISPDSLAIWKNRDKKNAEGFFRFGPDLVCYGKSSAGTSPHFDGGERFDALAVTSLTDSGIDLPFDFSSVIENLRREHYVKQLWNGHNRAFRNLWVRRSYYAVREFLPVGVRRHLQKAYFKEWQKIPFPNWPVDFTADSLIREFLKLSMRAHGWARIPFIWFWPEGAPACAVLTHDVETAAGRDFSSTLMDIDLSEGFTSSFQVVPEKRYEVPDSYLNEIRSRSFELNVHDFNHDGFLFQDKVEFEKRAKLINSYAAAFQSRGFRAGAMYRNADWYSSFEFSYDMSVPNVAHLEPQRGGCCTVMPFFVGDILEIPLTTIQDYTLFHILEDFSIDIWKRQISLILQKNGLMSFLSHPDYLIDQKARGVYQSLLAHLREVCDREHVWHPLPGDLDRWWRARQQMSLVQTKNGWHIEGPESRQARVAYASLEGNDLVYTVERDPAS
jgi:hypothetical protein